MNVRVIARDSFSFTGRKCPVCNRVARPGQTVVCDQNIRWVAHRLCLVEFITKSYETIPGDGEPVKRRTRVEREEAARQRADQRFTDYREHLLKRFGIKE